MSGTICYNVLQTLDAEGVLPSKYNVLIVCYQDQHTLDNDEL